MDADKACSVAVFDDAGRVLFTTRLPERGHDATPRPGSDEFVVFARRPGNWAAVVDRRSGAVGPMIVTPPERHFYGHGIFSPDGRLLYATENLIATGDGVLGIYDATAGYVRVGELPSFGIGPHDIAALPGSRHLLVANGGLRTAPDTGREILNPEAMSPSLAILDPVAGTSILKVELGQALRGLSIRHLAVAGDGEAVFACQFNGDPDELPPLVGLMRADGSTTFLEMPDDDLAAMANYVGSVSLDRSERLIAATSPIGSMVAFWDRQDGRYLGRRRLSDVCGVAPMPMDGVFVLSSGNAGVKLGQPSRDDLVRIGGSDLDRWMWDNHILSL